MYKKKIMLKKRKLVSFKRYLLIKKRLRLI